jgi:regulator of nucleoside diphosphate kinase
MSFLDPRPAITVTEPDADRLLALSRQIRPRQPGIAAMLEAEVGRAAIVAPDQMPPDIVTMHSHAVFAYAHSQRSHWLTLVYPGEADLDLAKISIATPVGAALIGLRAGDSIGWTLASGEPRRIMLREVAYQPERCGRYDL